MADQKISELAAATSAAGADLLNIVQGGQNKKLTIQNFLANLNSPVIINESGADVDTRVEGISDQNLVVVDASADSVGFGTANPTEKVDVAGNLSVTGGYVRLQGAESVTSYPATLDATVGYTVFTVSGATDAASLPAPLDANLATADGAMRVLVFGAGAGTLTVTPTVATFSNISFTAQGDTATLLYVNDTLGWVVIAVNGASVS
jgi:hypothetical protein